MIGLNVLIVGPGSWRDMRKIRHILANMDKLKGQYDALMRCAPKQTRSRWMNIIQVMGVCPINGTHVQPTHCPNRIHNEKCVFLVNTLSPGAESQRLGTPDGVGKGWWVTCPAGSLLSGLSPCWCLSSRSRDRYKSRRPRLQWRST